MSTNLGGVSTTMPRESKRRVRTHLAARNRARQIDDDFSSENRRRNFADLQTEAEGHERSIDPTSNPTFSASTRNALGLDDAVSCCAASYVVSRQGPLEHSQAEGRRFESGIPLHNCNGRSFTTQRRPATRSARASCRRGSSRDRARERRPCPTCRESAARAPRAVKAQRRCASSNAQATQPATDAAL